MNVRVYYDAEKNNSPISEQEHLLASNSLHQIRNTVCNTLYTSRYCSYRLYRSLYQIQEIQSSDYKSHSSVSEADIPDLCHIR